MRQGHTCTMSRIRSTISTPYAAVNRHHKLTPGQLLTILFDGPGPATCRIEGKKRRFFGYEARGAPDGPDDGSLAPWAVAASLPFAPEIVAPALRYFETLKLRQSNPYGFKATFNATIGERPIRRNYGSRHFTSASTRDRSS